MKLVKLINDEQIKKLEYLPFNRKYCVRHDLIKSMNEFGFIHPILVIQTDIITGRMGYFILDGQHRLATAHHLGIVPFMTVVTPNNVDTIEELVKLVANLNSKTKPWTIVNYADAYSFLNYKEYKTLIRITESSAYTMATVARLLQGIGGRATNQKDLQDGKFVASHIEETNETLAYAAELSRFNLPSSRMVMALSTVMKLKKFDKDKFTKRYKAEWKTIKEMNYDDYTQTFRSWII